MITFDLNWIAIGLCVVANMVIGALWFGPLFGRRWMKELDLKKEFIESGQMWKSYVIAVVNSVLMAFVLAQVIVWTGVTGITGGLLLGLLMWAGFTGFAFAVNHAFEGRSAQLWFINSGMYLVGLLAMGVILTVV
ncbi:MAG: DUF1761 domain-containing protein [Candidatus Delongbacteria bacterium]|nr:DUF1761 domain-containing protein [bacterium]MBL7032921.1 DUF1761 domain-containing protein [Candidatus Delongbacteria bacterium]